MPIYSWQVLPASSDDVSLNYCIDLGDEKNKPNFRHESKHSAQVFEHNLSDTTGGTRPWSLPMLDVNVFIRLA